MKKYARQLIRQIVQTKTLNQYEHSTLQLPDANITYRNFTFRKLNQKDFHSNEIFKEKDRINRYINHMKKGHQCYGFESHDGSIAAYFWLTIGQANQPIPNPAFKAIDWLITKNEAYIWDCRSIPAYQQQGLYREGLKCLVHLCQQQKLGKIMISCEPENRASDAGIKSAGFQFKGTVFTMRTKLFKWIRCSHKKPKISNPSSPTTTEDVFPWN